MPYNDLQGYNQLTSTEINLAVSSILTQAAETELTVIELNPRGLQQATKDARSPRNNGTNF